MNDFTGSQSGQLPAWLSAPQKLHETASPNPRGRFYVSSGLRLSTEHSAAIDRTGEARRESYSLSAIA
jgi:hypothetical protein